MNRDFGMDSKGGRFGNFWWNNSNQAKILRITVPLRIGNIDFGMDEQLDVIQWGSCGFGLPIRLSFQPVE
jgi:hypothetical protein